MRSTPLRYSRDLQAVINLANALTVELVGTAQALVATGYSARQAADLLDITPAALRQRLTRLRDRVHQALGAYQMAQTKSPDRNLRYGADERAYQWAASPLPSEDPS